MVMMAIQCGRTSWGHALVIECLPTIPNTLSHSLLYIHMHTHAEYLVILNCKYGLEKFLRTPQENLSSHPELPPFLK